MTADAACKASHRSPGQAISLMAVASAIASAFLWAGPAAAAEPTRRLSGADQNSARVLSQPVETDAEVLAEGESNRPWSASLGLARSRDQPSMQVLTTPFLVAYERQRWYFEANGDGYSRKRSGDETRRGLADIAVLARYNIPSLGAGGRFNLASEVEWDFPTRHAVGSMHASQAGRLELGYGRDRWQFAMQGEWWRNGDVGDGEARTTKSLRAWAQYNWADEKYHVKLKGRRSEQAGTAGTSELLAEWQFPLPWGRSNPKSPRWSGILIGTQGLGPSRHSAAVEFDLGCSF